jgi:1-carboxybiuret hydrolase subunit AtzG-like
MQVTQDTMSPDPNEIAAYVRAAAPLAGLALDAEREAAVIAAFALVCRIAAPALAYPLPRIAEPPAISAVAQESCLLER